MKIINVIGMGPGNEKFMTDEAKIALDESDVIVGYGVYLELLSERYKDKELYSTPMKQEEKRCRYCYDKAVEGKNVSLICSGDAGIYGMASLMYEIGKDYPDCDLNIIPGITAASSGAALLGAPINHDFCVISLSDLLTPWDKIEKRLKTAAEADFAIVIYNPSSHKRADYLARACDILLEKIEPSRSCGYVFNIGREGTKTVVCTLSELRDAKTDMFTTVFIGNSTSEIINGKLVTKRGYPVEKKNEK
ncbi:MAG: precorrin-3B C(17)-methyltransferase [Lachnospiraceae bacterium]|nr:precorrin-3B C(17)-methyltransferase [Lachnospiraceae bacterium]